MFSACEIVERLKALRGKENQVIAEIVRTLSEINRSGVYREMSYSSLFSFCMKELGYSEGAACRRIQAAKLLESDPEVYELLRAGKLSLCAASELFKVKEEDARRALMIEAQGRSKREVEKLTAPYVARKETYRETVKVRAAAPELPLFKTDEKHAPPPAAEYTITLQVNEEFMKLLDEAKCFLGPCKNSVAIEKALKSFVGAKKKAPVRKAVERSEKKSRYISRAVRHEVRERDSRQCAFVSREGVRCSEKRGLQFDHVVPFASGGENTVENLRLLCPAHNQLHAEAVFRSLEDSAAPLLIVNGHWAGASRVCRGGPARHHPTGRPRQQIAAVRSIVTYVRGNLIAKTPPPR